MTRGQRRVASRAKASQEPCGTGEGEGGGRGRQCRGGGEGCGGGQGKPGKSGVHARVVRASQDSKCRSGVQEGRQGMAEHDASALQDGPTNLTLPMG